VALFGQDTDVGGHETAEGRVEAEWVLMARRLEDFGSLSTDSRWRRLEGARDARVWTDDYTDIVSTLKVWGR
jgi:hypothetical protein